MEQFSCGVTLQSHRMEVWVPGPYRWHQAPRQRKEVHDEEAGGQPGVGERDGGLVDAFAAAQDVLKSGQVEVHG